MRVPLVDLRAQFLPIRVEIMHAIEEVLESMHLFLGPNVEAFEREFAAYCGSGACVGVANGTDALHLALRAAGVGDGDEVITVAHTFFATTEAIVMAGARPVYVDIDPTTYLMDVSQIESRISPRTRAIIPVHLYGQMADMGPIMEIAERNQLVVIEDAAQAHGAEYRGRRAGSIGHLGCFSFYFSKNLGAYGESGAVVTSDPELEQRLRLLRDHGSQTRYHHDVYGFNSRLDEIQAAVLRIKLQHLDTWNRARTEHAAEYGRLLSNTGLGLPEVAPERTHIYYVYVVRSRERERLRQILAERDIGTGIHFPIPIHLQEATRELGYQAGDLPNTEEAAQQVLSLPMYAELTSEQIDYVVSAVRAAVKAGVNPQHPPSLSAR